MSQSYNYQEWANTVEPVDAEPEYYEQLVDSPGPQVGDVMSACPSGEHGEYTILRNSEDFVSDFVERSLPEARELAEVIADDNQYENSWEKLMAKFEVTQELVQGIEEARPIFHSLIFHQQNHVWIAEPNAGKTTIANHAAKRMADEGFKVWYINLDASAPDLKYYQRLADEGNYKLMAPLADGLSEQHLVEAIDHLANMDADLSDYVLILDTLKKFTNVISKQSKGFYKKLRALTRKGVTVISLAHANKYRGEDNRLVPEGTSDLKTDCDNLSLMYKVIHEDHQVVSTVSDDDKGGKKRAPLVDMSFRMNPDRTVEVLDDYVDTQRELELKRLERDYGDAIERAKAAIQSRPLSEYRFLKAFKDEDGEGPGGRIARKLAIAFAGKHWDRKKNSGANNSIQYSAIRA